MSKGAQGTATITGVAHGGHGIFRLDGRVCFVPGALPGDTIAYRVDREQKGVLWATMLEVFEPSPDRVAVDVPLHGGNQWLPFAYPAQGEWKQRIVSDCLERIAGIEAEVTFLEDANLRTGYRTRATIHGDGKKTGFYARGTKDIVGVEQCRLLHARLNGALATLRELCMQGSVDVTVNPDGDDVLVWTRDFNGKLAKHFTAYNWLKDDQRRHFFPFDGAPIVNGAFSQASLLLNRLLVHRVHELLAGAHSVLDLYCGNGNLTITLPLEVDVTGIDHNRAAINAANGIRDGAYRFGKGREFREALQGNWDAVVLDPPREGAKEIVEALCACKASRMLYVSCDPAALARDLKGLTGADWRIADVTVIDMFPHTPHVETLVHLSR